MNTAYKYDMIEGWQGDEPYLNSHQEDDAFMVKTTHALSLNELMSIDHTVWIKRNARFGFDLEVGNEEDSIIYKDDGIHPYAIESLAAFCRQFLYGYSQLLDKEIA